MSAPSSPIRIFSKRLSRVIGHAYSTPKANIYFSDPLFKNNAMHGDVSLGANRILLNLSPHKAQMKFLVERNPLRDSSLTTLAYTVILEYTTLRRVVDNDPGSEGSHPTAWKVNTQRPSESQSSKELSSTGSSV
jgi:hypothetical protein